MMKISKATRTLLLKAFEDIAPDASSKTLEAFLDKVILCLQKQDFSGADIAPKNQAATAMDSALLIEERHQAKAAIRPLVGNVLGMDQATPEDIYRYGLNHIGIKTEAINLQGLKSLAAREANYRSPQRPALARDQALAENANPEEIVNAYVQRLKSKQGDRP